LTISPAEGDFSGAPAKHGWIVRFHLAKEQTVRWVHGGAAQKLEYKLLQPSTTPIKIPFLGAGSPPPAETGPIVEVKLPPEEVSNARQIEISVR
jgi:hypothetical protein